MSGMPRKMAEIVDAAEAVVATAFGNIDGLTEADQLEALRMAAAALRDALKS